MKKIYILLVLVILLSVLASSETQINNSIITSGTRFYNTNTLDSLPETSILDWEETNESFTCGTYSGNTYWNGSYSFKINNEVDCERASGFPPLPFNITWYSNASTGTLSYEVITESEYKTIDISVGSEISGYYGVYYNGWIDTNYPVSYDSWDKIRIYLNENNYNLYINDELVIENESYCDVCWMGSPLIYFNEIGGNNLYVDYLVVENFEYVRGQGNVTDSHDIPLRARIFETSNYSNYRITDENGYYDFGNILNNTNMTIILHGFQNLSFNINDHNDQILQCDM